MQVHANHFPIVFKMGIKKRWVFLFSSVMNPEVPLLYKPVLNTANVPLMKPNCKEFINISLRFRSVYYSPLKKRSEQKILAGTKRSGKT